MIDFFVIDFAQNVIMDDGQPFQFVNGHAPAFDDHDTEMIDGGFDKCVFGKCNDVARDFFAFAFGVRVRFNDARGGWFVFHRDPGC